MSCKTGKIKKKSDFSVPIIYSNLSLHYEQTQTSASCGTIQDFSPCIHFYSMHLLRHINHSAKQFNSGYSQSGSEIARDPL